MSNDALTFAGVSSYFVIVTFLIGISPLSGQCPDGANCNFIIAPDQSTGGATASNSGPNLALQISSGILCAGALGVVGALAFFTAGVGLFGFLAAGSICTVSGLSIFAPGAITTVADAATAAFKFLVVFFELLTFQLPIPFILNALIVLPGAAPLLYMGVKVLRGGG